MLSCSSEDQLEEQAEEQAIFVPIQIDIDVDTFKIRDAFVWNINGTFRGRSVWRREYN